LVVFTAAIEEVRVFIIARIIVALSSGIAFST